MLASGIIHVHSTYSYDGKESLGSLKEFLVGKGINFCCLTEHTDYLTKEKAAAMVAEAKSLCDENFVFIPGFEVPYKESHILLIGGEEFLGSVADGELLRQWSHKCALTVLAHPVRNQFVVDDTMLEVIDGVEIWNQQYEGKIVPRTRSMKLLESLKLKKPGRLATGGTDFHRLEHFGPPLYQLEVDELTSSAILEKLKSGDYTFGSQKVSVNSEGKVSGDISNLALKSFLSVGVINLGKLTNKTLASLGLKLPKSLKQLIRSKV